MRIRRARRHGAPGSGAIRDGTAPDSTATGTILDVAPDAVGQRGYQSGRARGQARSGRDAGPGAGWAGDAAASARAR